MDDLPGWVQYTSALGPVLIFLGALIAAIVAALNLRHRRQQDRKDEWWRRTQWALDQVLKHDDAAREVGLNVLALQADSKLGDAEDALLIDAVADEVLARLAPAASTDTAEHIDYRVEIPGDEDER